MHMCKTAGSRRRHQAASAGSISLLHSVITSRKLRKLFITYSLLRDNSCIIHQRSHNATDQLSPSPVSPD